MDDKGKIDLNSFFSLKNLQPLQLSNLINTHVAVVKPHKSNIIQISNLNYMRLMTIINKYCKKYLIEVHVSLSNVITALYDVIIIHHIQT